MKKLLNIWGLLTLLLVCCRKPYSPPAAAFPGGHLVVEGVINSGSDSTIIQLSKTVKLDTTATLTPVTGATVTVQSNQNKSWPLVGDGHGKYASPGLNLSAAQQYRLVINADGSTYMSDFVPVIVNPPIDSVGYTLKNGGIQVYVNNHNPTNSTNYYRWDFGEAWQFHAEYLSRYIPDSVTRSMLPRPGNQQIYYCFAHDTSSTIILASTAHLTNNVVYQSPITNVPLTSEKLEIKYSIIVKQYALTAAAYQFYYYLRQNTEQLGTIFDAEPSQIKGNIHNTANPDEPVIGYITATNIQSKRIFISSSALPAAFPIFPYNCSQVELKDQPLADLLRNPHSITNRNTIVTSKDDPDSLYMSTSRECADCTVRGTLQPPPFWK